MASFSIIWTPRAKKQLKSLPQSVLRPLLTAVNALAENPYPQGCRKLVGYENSYRIRHGDYRTVYRIENQQLIVVVVRVGHRKEVYRGELG